MEDSLLVSSVNEDQRPTLSGSRVLFQSDQFGTFDIFSVVGPGVSTLVASGTGNLEDPRVDGDVAVWTDDSSGDSEVIFYDLATGISENISASRGNDLDPDVDGETAVWVSDSTGSPEVFYWSVAVPVRQPIALTPGADRAPAISGDRVVWATNSTVRVGLDLVVSEIGSGTFTTLDDTATLIRSVSLDGSLAAYIADDEVYVIDVDSGVRTRLTSAPATRMNVRIAGSWVVWDEDAGVSFDVIGHELTLGETHVLSAEVWDERVSDLDGQSLVYEQYRFGDSDINRIDFRINTPPLADAGPDHPIIFSGEVVTFDGSQSFDADGDEFTFSWVLEQKPSGSVAELTDATAATPSFTADVLGTYVVRLTVTDSVGDSTDDTVTASFDNLPPVADAGTSQSALVGDTVILDGSASSDPNDPDGLLPLTYLWTLVETPEGSLAALGAPDAVTATLVPDVAGLYRVELVVNDGRLDSAPDAVELQAIVAPSVVTDAVADTQVFNAAIDPVVFRNEQLQSTLGNKLNAVLREIAAGDYVSARNKLANDILGKVDGCSDTGKPDRNDWVKDCAEQTEIYALVINAIALLDGLISGSP